MTRKTSSGASNETGAGKKALALLIGTICGNIAATDVSVAGPTGGVVTQGQGAISTPTNTSTVVDQASNRLSIDWRSFDVASNESVRFNQPTSNSVALNRILDSKPSEVFGRIDANGRVVLLNSHGIMFGAGSQVNVGSLLATSLNVVSFDDATGQLRLQALGSPGSIVNNGTITAAPGGSVSLVGGSVANNGHIMAELGSVNLAAGRAATLDFYGGGLLRFEADSALLDNPGGAAAGVANTGEISASGGQVLLTTSAAQNVFSRAVNNDGLVSANRIENVGGAIRLVGAGGTVVNSGVLDASGVGAGSTGGSVQVLGQNVGLFGNARVDVSGDAGGGTALIGGDYQGANPDVLNANRTVVAPGAQINADARVAGDGGRVILWSDDVTRFYGGISARGGAESGNGGFTEISSHGALEFDGRVDMGALAGANGRLLLDPGNITIASNPMAEPVPPDITFDFSDDDPVFVDPAAIVAALNTTDLELQARGDILVNEAIDAGGGGAGNGLTLRARDDIQLSANITNNGDIILSANDQTGDLIANPPFNAEATGDVTFLHSGITLTTVAGTINISGEGNIPLGTLSGGSIIVTSTDGSVTQLGGATLTGTSLNVTADTNIALTTAIDTSGAPADTLSATAGTSLNISNTGSLRVASVDAGTALTLSNAGAMSVANAAAGDNVSLTTTSGDLTVGMVNAGDTAIITSNNGAILDAPGGTAVSGTNGITLNAETAIGSISSVDLLAGNAGTPLVVNTLGNLSATVDQANGEINLGLAQIPAGTFTVDLGGGGVASGRILLQRTGAFDVDAEVPDDLFDLGVGNTAAVGFRSTAQLTLPVDMQDKFVDAPGTLAVAGANVVDTDPGAGANDLSFTVGNLAFHSASATPKTLNTDVGSLTAVLATNADLTVVETDGIALTNLTGNNVNVTSAGLTTVTAINANATTGLVTLNAGANAINGGGVVGDQLTISAASGVNLNTDVNSFTAATVGAGGIVINETSGPLAVSNATSTGLVDISTTTGNLTVTTASGNGLTLEAGNNLVVNGAVDSNGGLATLSAGNQLTTTAGTVDGASANLTSNGAMALGTVNIVGTVTLAAGAAGAISGGDVRGTLLTINSASGVDLDTDVNTINANNVGSGGISIDEVDGPLLVANANTTGAVDISTGTGAMTVTTASGNAITLDAATSLTVNGTVSAGAGLADLNAGTTLTTTAGTLNAGTMDLTSNGAMALGTVNSAGGVTLAAGGAGAISGGTVSGTLLTVNSASGVNLDTNVDSFNATTLLGPGGITINEANGPLSVANANTVGAVDISTTAGNLTVTTAAGNGVTLDAGAALTVNGTVSAGAGAAILTAGSTLTTTAGIVNAGSANLTSNGAMGLGAVNVTGNVTLAAGTGAISGGTVDGNLLTVNSAGSVTLATNVNQLTATGIGGGGITVVEQSGPLLVNSATSIGGAVAISTTSGDLTVTNAAGAGVTLNAGSAGASGDANPTGNLTVTNVTVTGPATAAATLIADGAITINTAVNAGPTRDVTLRARDGAIADGATTSVVADQLTIDDANSVNLDTNVAELIASGVSNGLTISDQAGDLLVTNAAAGGAVDISTTSGNLTVVNASGTGVTLGATGAGAVITLGAVNAGGGNVTVTAAAGSITDDDDGTATTTQVTGANVALTAATNIGTVTTFETAAGRSVDVQTSGQLTANVTTNVAGPVGGQINLNIAGGPNIAADGIRLGNILTANRVGRVLLQSAGNLNLGLLTPGAINVGATNSASVGYVSGGDLTLPAVSLTDTAPLNLLISADDVFNSGGTRTIGLSANTAVFNAFDAGGDFTLNTSVGTLHSNVGAVGLTVNENLDGITLGAITASTLTVNANAATASILDDGDDSTVIEAGTITLDTTNVIGGGALAALDVDTDNLVATTDNGNITVNSVGTGPVQVNVTSFGGDVSLLAAGDVGVTTLSGAGVNLNAAGAITDAAGSTPSVVAIQLSIAGAASANLDTNVSLLDATGVTGTLDIREQTGGLAVTNASAGTVNVSTAAGVLTVTNATSTSGAVSLTAGGVGNSLTVTNASGNGANLTAGGGIVLGAVNAGAGTATLAAGGAITDAAGAAPSVVAGQLAIANATSANLDTDVSSLSANNVTGALIIREQAGDLAVASANAGSVDLTTVTGALTGVNASAGSVVLTANTGISLNSVTSTGAATLAAGGAVTDAAGAAPSVNADQLGITAASADLDTNVNTLTANVTGALAIRDQVGALAVANVTAGTSASLSSAGALSLGTVTAGTATLAAGGAITDAAGATPSVVATQLTITGAGSADLDTDVNALDASGVTSALSVREQTGALAVTNASAAGAVNVSTVAGALDVTSAAGNDVTLTAGGANDLTLGTVSAGTGTATLAAGGAISDGAGAAPSVVAGTLRITGAASADLDTNVNTLNASVTGALTVREQTALAVTNAASTGGAVNVSTVAGALTGVNATGTNVTLTAGGAGNGISLGTVNANATTGTVTLTAAGAVTDAAGTAASVVANQLSISGAASIDLDTNVNTLNTSGVTGALSVREQAGALTVTNATSTGGAVNVSTVAGAMTVTNAAGNGVTLNAGGAGSNLTLGSVNAGVGAASLGAGGAITDAAGATPSVVAGTLTITGAASADLDTNVNTLNASGVTGALTIREQTGALAVTNAASTGGAVTVSTVAGALTGVNATGTNVTLTAGGAGNGISLGTVNANPTTGNVTLTGSGVVNDAAGAAASVVANQLTISNAASVDLDTNVNTLSTSGVTGALSVREQAGALTVANATSTGGAVSLSTVAGAMTVTNAAGNGVTLAAGGAGNGLTIGTVNAGTGTATLAAGGAITDAAGATPSVVAGTLNITGAGSADLDTDVNTLNASGVTGVLTVREQTGALAVTNASAGGAVSVSTVNGNLTVTNAASSGGALTLTAGGATSTLNLTNGSGTSANLTSGGNMVIASNTLNVGTGAATLSAGGSLTDGTSGTALTAGAATLTAASIGTASNTFDVSVNSLTATANSGGIFINEANDIALTNVRAATANQDIVVGALGSITVNQISNADGRVLLSGNRDILSTGSGTHITARSVELRAGRDTSGGRIGTAGQPLRISGPATVPGGANGTGDPVPNILVLQNQSAPGSLDAAQPEQLDLDSDSTNISRATFNPSAAALPASAFLTTTFSTRTASGADRVTVANAPFDVNGALNGDAQVGLSTRGAGALLTASGASNAQGEGTLYIDWASFDPNVSLFGTVNPPICLPADQSDEDSGDAAATTSSGCASTTAQYDGSFRMPEVKLVITSRGVEWVTVPSGNVTVFPLIGQIR